MRVLILSYCHYCKNNYLSLLLLVVQNQNEPLSIILFLHWNWSPAPADLRSGLTWLMSVPDQWSAAYHLSECRTVHHGMIWSYGSRPAWSERQINTFRFLLQCVSVFLVVCPASENSAYHLVKYQHSLLNNTWFEETFMPGAR